MKRYIISLSLIILVMFFVKTASWAADYSSEILSDPIQSSIIKNTDAERKLVKFRKRNKKQVEEQKKAQKDSSSEVLLDSEFMNYYPEKYEVEAIGNAKVVLPAQKVTLYADRIVYNHDLNNIKAYDNVKLVNDTAVTDGDFLNLDLNRENGIIKNPFTSNYAIQISSNEGYLYSDRIEEYNGVAKILKNYKLKFGSGSFSNIVNPGQLSMLKDKTDGEEQEKGVYRIKAKVVEIDSRPEHNILTMNNAEVYLKNIKIGTVPSIKFTSDKDIQFVETNIPEFGSASELGMYIGPSIVLNTPGASTLKLSPLLNYDQDKFGVGFISRFRSAKNFTQIAYGSTNDKFLIKGRHEITDDLDLTYSQNAYQDEWFLGFRRPQASAQLQWNKRYDIDDLDLRFSQRVSAGLFTDKNTPFSQSKGRFRWMTQSEKPLYYYENENGDFSLAASVVVQSALSLYSTGDNVAVGRIGPMLNTTYKRWNQKLIYLESKSYGQTPFRFDRYVYGKSNLVFIETFKLNNYLTFGYLGSIVLDSEKSGEDRFKENRFLIAIGPEYARVMLGYDAYRQNTMMLVSMAVGTEGSTVDFKKAVVKNPDTLGKSNSKDKESKKHFVNINKIFPEWGKQSDKKQNSVNDDSDYMNLF